MMPRAAALFLTGSTGTRARILGHDGEGRAVFYDLDHQGPQPLRAPTADPATWDHPAVFRLHPRAAAEHYGEGYAEA